MRIRTWQFAPFAALCLASILIPYAGLESDEAVFGMAVFGGLAHEFCISIFHHQLPLMIFYYAGSLKGLLYWPILHLLGPNVWSIRMPMAVATALSVILVYDFASRIAGRKVAAITAFLVATDPCFIISSTFDWGPVAIEHVLLLSALVLFVRGRPSIACFFLGLGLWNKAIFGWALMGLAIGGLVAYSPAIRQSLPDWRAVRRCMASFLGGCVPLLLYNARQHAATLRSNVHLSFEGLQEKLASLHYTLDGSDLFGVVAGMDGVVNHSGLRFHGLFFAAVMFSIVVIAWRARAPQFRPALFALAYCTASFFCIAATQYAGAAHHIVLLYPMPHLLVAVAIASVRWKYLPGLLTILLVGSNLLVFSTYVTQLRRSGSYGLFTDATNALSNSLNDASDHVYSIDYGLWENVWLMHEGRLSIAMLRVLAQPASDVENALKDPSAVFVNHLPGREYFSGSGEHLDQIAGRMGLRRTARRTIYDLHGRPQMEVFRFAGSSTFTDR